MFWACNVQGLLIVTNDDKIFVGLRNVSVKEAHNGL
jgi:hypothetical protein